MHKPNIILPYKIFTIDGLNLFIKPMLILFSIIDIRSYLKELTFIYFKPQIKEIPFETLVVSNRNNHF